MAHPNTLTPETATAYIRATVATWGAEWADAEIGAATMGSVDGIPVCAVSTSNGNWDVWMQDDGTLYGEC